MSRVTSFGASAPGNEDGADDDVRVRNRLLDLEARGHEERHAGAEHLLQLAHPVDRALDDRDARAEPECDHRRVVADHPAPDDDDLARGDARHAAEQQAPAAQRLLEEVGAGLRREPPRDLAHRSKQRQRAVGSLDGFVRDGGDPALDQCAREVLVGREVKVGEENEAVAEPVVLRGHRLLHLQQELDVAPDVLDRHELDALGLVRRVREGAPLPGAALDEHVVPTLDELASTGRRQRDAVFVGLDLLGDADPHLEPGNLTFRTTDTFSLHTRAIFRD